ncbi:MAG: hypothetical protein F6J93_05850 [Oscillatoria sp. SIO1A7]|nr:hypothetical protein [Oscillatoria sp. SIO1A7]
MRVRPAIRAAIDERRLHSPNLYIYCLLGAHMAASEGAVALISLSGLNFPSENAIVYDT